MAIRYIGLEKGANMDAITQNSSTTSKTFEFTIDLADAPTREEALLALEQMENYILQNSIWPMA